jgi:hypothetical protein
LKFEKKILELSNKWFGSRENREYFLEKSGKFLKNPKDG